jgi:hypothetical protein
MLIDDLRKARRAEPFKPFTLNLADGRKFLVPHPEFMLVPPEGRRLSIVVYDPDEGYEIIDPTLITSLTVSKDGKRKPRSNGNGH